MNSYRKKYNNQKHFAKIRNIDWEFTYESWLEWWGDDIVNRGTKSGQLVMARNGDTGPYHPNNVRRVTSNENHSESCANGLGWQKGHRHSPETLAKLAELNKRPKPPGRKNAAWSTERRAKIQATWEAKRNRSIPSAEQTINNR